MSEEYSNNENVNQENEKDENCNCDCKKIFNGEKTFSKTENLIVISTVANMVTAICVFALAVTISFNGFQADLGKAEHQARPKQVKQLFKKESISLEDAMKEDKNIAVLFYADWCPHCQNFAPTYQSLSKDRRLKGDYNFVRINSESPNARAIMTEYQVEGFPALYLVNPKTGKKQFIPNQNLFGENAQENLVDIFQKF